MKGEKAIRSNDKEKIKHERKLEDTTVNCRRLGKNQQDGKNFKIRSFYKFCCKMD